jgi:hypothetical protein
MACITEMECVYCTVRAEYLTMIQVNRNLPKRNTLSEKEKNWIGKYFYHKKWKAVSWLRGFVAGFSPWKHGFDPGNVPESSVVKNVVLGHVFSQVFWFPPVGITPPTLSTHLHLPVALIRRTRRSLGTFRENNTVLEIGLPQIQKYFHLVLYG